MTSFSGPLRVRPLAGEPSDGQRFLLIALSSLWLTTFVYAFVAFTQTPFEGAGFIDRLNKPAAYLGWQGIAGIFAVAIFAVGLSWQKGSAVRRMSRLPILLAVLQGIAGLGVLYWTGAV